MELKTQISILTSSSGHYNFIWENEEDLLIQIEKIIESFSDPSESITPPKIITTSILNGFKDRIKTYGGLRFDIDSLPTIKPEIDDAIKKAVECILKDEDSKKGNYILSLSSDEIYQLFSLQEVRKSKLDQLL